MHFEMPHDLLMDWMKSTREADESTGIMEGRGEGSVQAETQRAEVTNARKYRDHTGD